MEENLDIDIDQDVKFRMSSLEDIKYLNAWMANKKLQCEKVFPGINPLGDRGDFGYSLAKWAFSFHSKVSITLEVKGIPVGIGSFWIHDSMALKHHGMFGIIVDPENSGRGYGKILMNGMLDFAKKYLELEFLELQVIENNIPAIRLYEKLGFKEEYRNYKFVKKSDKYFDMIVMRKIL